MLCFKVVPSDQPSNQQLQGYTYVWRVSTLFNIESWFSIACHLICSFKGFIIYEEFPTLFNIGSWFSTPYYDDKDRESAQNLKTQLYFINSQEHFGLHLWLIYCAVDAVWGIWFSSFLSYWPSLYKGQEAQCAPLTLPVLPNRPKTQWQVKQVSLRTGWGCSWSRQSGWGGTERVQWNCTQSGYEPSNQELSTIHPFCSGTPYLLNLQIWRKVCVIYLCLSFADSPKF